MDLYNATSTPSTLPVTLDQAKDHLQIPAEYTDKDALILGYIRTAVRAVEQARGLVCFHTSYTLVGEAFPLNPLLWPYDWILGRPFRPARQPLVSVASVTYREPSGATITLDPSRYVCVAGKGGYVRMTDTSYWPIVSALGGAVSIQFTAGFDASDASKVPATITQAILLLVAHYWTQREPVNVGNIVAELPMSAKWLLDLEDWGHYG